MARLARSGFTLSEPGDDSAIEPTLSGKAVVVTGAFRLYREGAEPPSSRVGYLAGSVSKKTFAWWWRVAGASKLTKPKNSDSIVGAENFDHCL